jgi:ubiquinone/menaquinone biosynthesis C-methylase UbiE
VFSGAHAALTEMIRVLKADGVLVLIDINYPRSRGFANESGVSDCGANVERLKAWGRIP